MKSTKQQRNELIDPDPFPILLAFLSAFSTIGVALGPVLVKEAFDNRREQKKRTEEIRRAFFDAYRTLNSLDRALKDYRTFIDQYRLWHVELRVGRGAFAGPRETASDIERLYADINRYGKTLMNRFVVMSTMLDGEDFKIVSKYVQRYDASFDNAFHAKKYADSIAELSKLLDVMKSLIVHVGERYGFSPSVG